MVDVQPAIDAELKKLLPPESYEAASHEKAPRSLFGEILDWMLAPLLLLWPMSIAVTYLVAQSIANAPFDRSLENSVQAIAQQIKKVDGQISLLYQCQLERFCELMKMTQFIFRWWDTTGS